MLKILKGSELMVTMPETEWVWTQIIPRNYVTILASRGGVGKSAFALWLADRLVGQGKRVLYVDAECCGSNIKTRNIHWKLKNFDGIDFTASQIGVDDDGNVINETACFAKIPELTGMAINGKYDLIILDSMTIIARGINMADRGPTAIFFKELTSIASMGRCGILLLAHTKKFQYDSQELNIDSISGSAAITDLSRSVLLMEKGPLPDERVLHHIKSNFAKQSTDIVFRLTEDGIKDVTVTDATCEVRDTGSDADRYRAIARVGITKGDTKKVIRKTLAKAGASASQRKRAIDDVSEELGIRWSE